MSLRTSRTLGAVAALAVLLPAGPLSAMTLGKPLNVAELVRRSSDIVVGTVSSVTESKTGSLPTIEVELKVAETIRGDAKGTLRFRQLAARAPGKAENGMRYVGLVPGLPSYTKGDAVLLFLAREGSLGLRTTVGLQQGRFALRAGNLENGFSNQGLFHGLSVQAKDDKEAALLATSRGAVGSEAFLGLLRRAVAAKLWDGGVR